jgi:hypothetical protein
MSDGSLNALADLLSECDTFQTITESDTPAEALAHIAIYSSTPPLAAPCAILIDLENTRNQLGAYQFYYSGRMGLRLELPRITDEDDLDENSTEYQTVKKIWEDIKDELQALGTSPGKLSIASIQDEDAEDSITERKDQRWFFTAEIEWPGGV